MENSTNEEEKKVVNLQIINPINDDETRFRVLCAKENKTRPQMFHELLNVYEREKYGKA